MSAILFDRAEPDEPGGRGEPAPGSPEDQAILVGGFAVLQAERLAAATAGVRERWWRLCLNRDPARAARLALRHAEAEVAQRHYVGALARSLREFRPLAAPERYARLHARAAELVEAANARAHARFAAAAPAN